MPTAASAIEVRVANLDDIELVRHNLATTLGSTFRVLNANEQHATLYRIMQNEKAVGYWVLTLMMLLTAVNILGGLAMVVMEKQRDIGMLVSLGADGRKIRNIFLANGLLVGGASGAFGLSVGILLVLSQDAFHWLKLAGGEHFVIDHFPVRLVGADVITVAATVVALSLLASWVPAQRAARSPSTARGQVF
jgi:lipoprotein-releasing system permease protein